MQRDRVLSADPNSLANLGGKTDRPSGDREKATGQSVTLPRSPGSTPSVESQRPVPASPRREDPEVDPNHCLVCPACENITMTERKGTPVCRHCGYTGRRPES
jgi:hypothetical protein